MNRIETVEERFNTLNDALQEKETELDQAQIERQLLKSHIESLERIQEDHLANLRRFQQENADLQSQMVARELTSMNRVETLEQELSERLIQLQTVQ
jgi:chromosome segregation ATPase